MNRILFLLIATMAAAAPVVARGSDGEIKCPGAGVSPHIAFGGGWSTTIYVNSTIYAGGIPLQKPHLTFRFYNATGNPLQVPISTSSGLTGRVSTLSLDNARGVEVIELLGTDAQTSVGWVVMQCSEDSAPVQITEVFRNSVAGRPDFEASVPFTDGYETNELLQATFPFDNRNGLETGFAVVNMRQSELGVPAWTKRQVGVFCIASDGTILRREALLDQTTIYGAWTLSSLFPEARGKFGSCSVSGAPNDISRGVPSVIALRFTPGGAFSTVPIWLYTR